MDECQEWMEEWAGGREGGNYDKGGGVERC